MRRTTSPAAASPRLRRPSVETLELRQFLSAAAAAEQPAEQTFAAAADAYVRGGAYASMNYGSATQLEVRNHDQPGEARESYVRFDLPGVAEVGSATLRVFGRLEDAAGSAAGAQILVYTGADTGWAESAPTWDARLGQAYNIPATVVVAGTTGQWYDLDVSEQLQERVDAGATAVSFIIRGELGATVLLGSDETAEAAQLIVRRDPPAVPPALVMIGTFDSSGEGHVSSVGLRLATRPAADVVVSVTKQPGGDPDLTPLASAFTFTPDDWYAVQSLHVHAAQDADTTNGSAVFELSAPGVVTRTAGFAEIDDEPPVLPAAGLRAAADAHVRGGTYAGTNFGAGGSVEVSRSNTSSDSRLAYLKFDLTGVRNFQRATIRLHGARSDARADHMAVDVGVAADPWTESGITWENRPADLMRVFGRLGMPGGGAAAKWHEVDVTRWVQERMAAGESSATFMLRGDIPGLLARFNSDEASSNRPELRLSNFEAAGAPPAPAGLTSIAPAADAYVRDGAYAATNFGEAPQLQVKRGSAGYTRDAYLRFDLSGQPTVTSAKLRVFGRLDNSGAASAGFTVYRAADTTWGESAVTWDNRPAAGATALGAATVVGTSGNWYEIDLTSFVQQLQTSGDKVFTLVLKASASSSSTVVLDSDESGNRPALVVAAADDSGTPQALVVSASSLTVNEGGGNTFYVRLAARPTSDVVVAVTRSAGGDPDLTASHSSVVFTPTTWDGAQPVTIWAAEDADSVDGSAAFALHADGLVGNSVTATESDNDVPPPDGAVRVLSDRAAYVRDGSHAATNFGGDGYLQVKKGSVGYNRESYVRFDLSALPADIGSATLRLTGRLDNTQQASVAFDVYASGDTTWNEGAVTWNTRLASGTSAIAGGTVAGLSRRAYELDVTEYLRRQRAAGASAVTLVLRSAAAGGSTILIESDEAAGPPQLVVTPGDEAPPPPPTTGATTLRAAADAYGRDGGYADDNFGAAGQLHVKRGSTGYARESFLRFDLSDVATVSSAKLRLFGRLDNTLSSSAGFSVYASPDTTWDEAGVTWNTRPASGSTPLASANVSGTAAKWYEVDLTAHLQAAKAAGATSVTLVLRASSTANSTILFESDEAAANPPELVIAG